MIDGKTYTKEVDEDFKLKKENLILVELDRSITYQIKFEVTPHKSSEEDINEFKAVMNHIKKYRNISL